MKEEITPQDKAINHHIPLFFYHVYEVDDELYGHLVDWKPAWQAEKDYDFVYHFNGAKSHYWIATNDASILRKEALAFAISIHDGKCRNIHIDLSEITGNGGKK